MTTVATQAPVIRVAGTLLSNAWLNCVTDMRIERAFGLVSRATIRFADPGYSLATTNLFALGTSVTITLSDGSELFSGDVTGVSLDQSASGVTDLLVLVDDPSYKLGRGTKVQTFSQVSFTDIIRKMAQQAGMQVTVPGGGEVFPYLLQSGSDLHYLNAMVERAGFVWWVDMGRLMVADPLTPSTTIELTLGEDLTEFSVSATGLRPDEVNVSGWNVDRKQPLLGRSSAAAPGPSEFVKNYTTPSSGLSASATAIAADRNPTTATEATSLATSLYADWAAGTIVTRGRGPINSAIAPGTAVSVAGAGPTSGTYIVTSVEHNYGPRGFTTRFASGQHRPSGLVDTLGGSPGSVSNGFNAQGLIIGLVTNIHDPDGIGRVKVKYGSLSGDIESNWARVLVVGAGPNRGVVFQPEVNDEVLVGFERGDPRRPVVLGGLFSANSTPPWVAGQGESDVRARRLSSRLGHVIEMGDGQGATDQHLLLKLASGHRLRLGEDRFDLEMSQGKPLLIKVGNSKIEIDGQGNISIEGMTISLKATQGVKVEGMQVDLKGTNQASVQATTVSIKGTAATAVEASGALTLKGAAVAIN